MPANIPNTISLIKIPATTMYFYRHGSQIALLSEKKLSGFISCLRTSTFGNESLCFESGFVQNLLCEGMLTDEDTWQLPNSMDKKTKKNFW